MNIHSRVFWIGVAWCILCLTPILFLQHIRDLLYSSDPAIPIGSVLVAIVTMFGIGGGIFLMCVSGKRGLYILIGSFVSIVLLYVARFGTAQLIEHPQSLVILWALSVALGGGISLLAIGILKESSV